MKGYAKLGFRFVLILILLSITNSIWLCGQNDSLNIVISDIKITGNKVTKEHIILRELLIEKSKTYKKDYLDQLIIRSKENLLNTSLFNFVNVSLDGKTKSVVLNIDVVERWYVWPFPVLEHSDRNLSSFFQNGDWSRIDYGLFLLFDNFRGRRELLKIRIIAGYQPRYTLLYYKPFIDRKKKWGAGILLDYLSLREAPYGTIGNESQYLDMSSSHALIETQAGAYLTYRPAIYNNHQLSIMYKNSWVSDSVLMLNKSYYPSVTNREEYLSIEYRFDHDKRDSKIYPLTGHRWNIDFKKDGFGIFTDKIDGYRIRTSTEGYLPVNSRLYLNSGIELKFTDYETPSYYTNQSFGYKNYIRGYEYYVFDGEFHAFMKSNFKFNVLKQKVVNLNWLSWKQFNKIHFAIYSNIFFDGGYVSKDLIQGRSNPLNEAMLYSGGIGIDLVTYYDKVLRFEYSINHLGERGFFLHIGAPIMNK